MNTNSSASSSCIEPLESRIAPAAVFTFTDVDGDKVTITTSKGTSDQLDALFNAAQLVPAGTLGGLQLKEIDFSADASTFEGTNLTITATPQDLTPGDADKTKSGDGLVNVGRIDATASDGDGTALNLGAVTIKGDLGQVTAGTDSDFVPAVKSINVQSMGVYGQKTGALPGFQESNLAGDLGSLTVKGSMRVVYVNALAGGKIGSVSVGDLFYGNIYAEGDLGPVKVARDSVQAAIAAGGAMKSVTIAGSATNVTQIVSTGPMGTVKIGSNFSNSILRSESTISSVVIGGSMESGPGSLSCYISAKGKITSVSIGRDLIGGNSNVRIATDPGSNADIGSITIGGSIIGGVVEGGGSIKVDGGIGSIKVGGDVVGGTSKDTGMISSLRDIGSISIGGSLVGGYFTGGSPPVGSGRILSSGAIGSIKIGADLLGSGSTDTGAIDAKRIGSVTIGGSMLGLGAARSAAIMATWDIGAVTVKGSLVFAFITAVGQENPTGEGTDLALKSLTVGGRVELSSILLGYDKNQQGKSSDAQMGSLKVDDDWVASNLVAGVNPVNGVFGDGGDFRLTGSASIRDGVATSKIASIVIGGQVAANPNDNTTYGFVAEEIGAFKYNGIAVALSAGKSNDTFALGKARAIGASLSPNSADGFAVHVFEV